MNAREQRLLAAFVLILVVGVTWLGWKRLNAAITSMRAEATAVARQADLDKRLVQSYEAEMKGAEAWVTERIGEPIAEQEALSQLLRAAQDTAREAGLSLTEPSFRPPEARGRLQLARLSAQVSGTEKAIYPWLAKFHDPGQLRSILGITIRPDKQDDTLVNCEVEFARWYLPSDGNSAP